MNRFFASIPKKMLFDINKYDYDCIIIPKNTLFTREFPLRKHGYKRISIDFDNVNGYNIIGNTSFLASHTTGNSFFTEHETVFFPQTFDTNDKTGIVIIDRIRLHPDNSLGYLKDWLPLQNVLLYSDSNSDNAIQDLSFCNHPYIKKVKFEDELKYIGCDSFSNCHNLKTVILGTNSINKIFYANRCFYNCPNLSTVIIPAKVNLNNTWFEKCPKVHYVSIKDTAITIPIEEVLKRR